MQHVIVGSGLLGELHGVREGAPGSESVLVNIEVNFGKSIVCTGLLVV